MSKEPRWLTDDEINNPDFKEWRAKGAEEWSKIYDYKKASPPLIVYDPWIWTQFCAWEEGKTPIQFAQEYLKPLSSTG